MKKKYKVHVKNGDMVKIISGKYKGEIGEITKILHKKKLVILKNLNLKTKHIKPNQKEENGKILSIEGPIHSSNVMLYSSKHGVCSRYNIIYNENLKKYRKLKKTQELIK